MKKITLLFGLLVSLISFGQTHDVTFQVDMNYYSGAFTTPEVNGIFNNWCGSCSAMTDANSDGVWEITIPIADDSTEFKYSFDNWTGQEALLPGSSCTKTTGANTNRSIVITGDTVLPVVCWESCLACTGAPTSAQVTFQVDMSDYSGSYTDVNINGTFNSWCGACNVMTSPNNDGIYEITLTVPTDSIEFKFTLDGWTAQEDLTEGLPCTKTVTDASGTFTNRVFTPSGDTILPVVCWESCAACGFVGVEENNWVNDLKITPNPSSGSIQINGNLNTSEEYTISVIDVRGRVIYESTDYNNVISKTIDLTFAGKGIYIIRFSNDTFSKYEKIILTE